jgi:phosphate-selective porin OprO/OprP
VVGLMVPAMLAAQGTAPDDAAARAATLQQLIASLRSSTPSTPEGAAETRAVLEALTARIEELDQQLRVLERKLEIEREQATERAKTTPAVTAGGQGYSLRSSDGSFQVRFRGYLQSDGRFVGDSDTTSGPSTFVMRRVRPVLEATAFKIFDFKVMPDFGGGQTVLQDAYADARFASWFRIRAGKYKAPFGLSRLQAATEMTFIERGTPTLIAPNRDLGVMAFGETLGDRLSYQFGVFNGVVDGGSADADDRSGKDVVARIFAHPFRKAQSDTFKNLGVGVAVSSGSQRGTIATPDLPAYALFANPASAARQADDWVGGINWYLNRVVKITAQYEQIQFEGGAADGGDRSTERGLFTRLQFAF